MLSELWVSLTSLPNFLIKNEKVDRSETKG
jgi:hypothetical protein